MNTVKATLAQCKAELLRTARNKRFVIFSIIMPVAFFFLFTSTVGNDAKVGGVNWSSYYLMSMTCYGIIGASFSTFSIRISRERSQGWIRLLRITPLPSWAYVVSKVAAQGIINLFIVIMMFVIGGLGKQISLPVSVWIESGLWIWIGGMSFMALGTLVGAMKNTDAVQVISTVLYMGLSILGGLWMPVESMSSTMQSISKFTPTYQLGHGAWNIIAGVAIDWSSIGILAAYVVVFMVLSSYILKKQEAV
ncbi:ABC transporter permease [Paenibacillus baekrokdamisoli]|uniref:ABC transporter permease n=1 Tax=Paenibacillus baekrokdamisoli TaxID=1712516 RepID=A0A3G9JIF2_9BACL|nr:ABC transporter permease [Paenibacillus baekrokdamisoli]MBB3068156.1 ABC-2 type transport system permease protein [Paenibacillus baekrokdamisoli]BBH22799.1 ABC transporter permease [Paenibacillus baekrokdamisoli]